MKNKNIKIISTNNSIIVYDMKEKKVIDSFISEDKKRYFDFLNRRLTK